MLTTCVWILDLVDRPISAMSFMNLHYPATCLLLLGERIVLPQSIFKLAVKRAHSMVHLECSVLNCQIRSHFALQKLDNHVYSEVKNCKNVQLYNEKGTKASFDSVYVPYQAWEYVSIDFFGPMTSGEHILVVQDLCTKYPVVVLRKTVRVQGQQ